jgi:hypothetical protein
MTCKEYADRRKAAKKPRLHWRSKKRSLGWIPFDARAHRSNIRISDDTVTYYGHTFRLWLHRKIVGTPIVGSFNQDSRKHWYSQRARKKKRVKAIYAKVANKRKDFAHKATTDITNRFDFIAVGNVSSAKLAKTRMAKSVYDAGWYQVRTLLQYKAQGLEGPM